MIEDIGRMMKWSPIRFAVPLVTVLCCSGLASSAEVTQSGDRVFRAGAAAVDITPTRFPVIVNGQLREGSAERAHDRLMSRAVVLDDGTLQLAIVVVDSLMMRQDLLDDAKQMAHETTGIPIDRMLISATHTHSAPSAMGCLGSRADVEYQPFLAGQIAKSIHQAASKLEPAKVGWGVVQDDQHNHCRRWVFRPDRMATDPFGVRNMRAHMHPGYQSKNHIAPSGPADMGLSLLSIQSKDGLPLAVLANYAMHYYGSPYVSGDFCGRFGNEFAALIGLTSDAESFVGIMSQGTSGDSMWMDYGAPSRDRNLEAYTREVATVAHEAYRGIQYHDYVSLGMAEAKLTLRRRVPDADRLAWARPIVAELGDRLPATNQEIYAREQLYLHEEPEVEIKLQAVRIGELGITAIPNEVYGLTGLKLKAQSPLQPTFNIELANGAQGYIPPPEQHALGGYTTWAARTAGLEVQAEPKIVEALLSLLEVVAEKPRREIALPETDYTRSVLNSKPVAYWQLSEMSGTRAADTVGKHDGTFEEGVVFSLPGVALSVDQQRTTTNRAAHFAGGRVQAVIEELGNTWSTELWFWNGLPSEARAVTGYLVSRGTPGSPDATGDHLGIAGTHMNADNAGKLIFFNGNVKDELLVGTTVISPKTWNHVVLVRDGNHVRIYLNGNNIPEINGDATVSRPAGVDDFFIGGRNDKYATVEGKLSDVAVYGRVLTTEEISAHFAAAKTSNPETVGTTTSSEAPQ